MHPGTVVGKLTGFAVASTAVAAAALLTGCSLVQPVSKEQEALQYAHELAAGDEMVCRTERPLGSRVKQRVCMTPQEAELRDLQARLLYRNSLVPLHGGRP